MSIRRPIREKKKTSRTNKEEEYKFANKNGRTLRTTSLRVNPLPASAPCPALSGLHERIEGTLWLLAVFRLEDESRRVGLILMTQKGEKVNASRGFDPSAKKQKLELAKC